jgi:hypothetical protein
MHNMEGTTLTTGTVKFDGDAHGIAFSVYVRENGHIRLWVKRGGMAILPGPGTMFGRNFSNVELGPKS